MHLSISAAASYLGVSISTLRRWHQEEYLIPDYLTLGGHRRYSISSLKMFIKESDETSRELPSKLTVLYARVSSSDQRQDLARQSSRLKEYAKKQGFSHTISLEDLGSGINYKKPGLNKLLKLLLNEQVDRLVLHHKDRLLRFGSELIFKICKFLNVEVIILEEALGQSFEQELVADVIEIITVLSSKLYGRRAHQNRLKKKAEQNSMKAA